MGNSNKKPQQYDVVRSFRPEEWVNVENRNGYQIWENPARHLKAQGYPINGDISQINLDHYQMRHNSSSDIVKVHNIRLQNDSSLCAKSSTGTVLVQRIPARLNDVNDLSQLQALTVLRSAYSGLNTISTFYGPVQPFEDMICFNEQGATKVWVNSNLAQNVVRFDRRYHPVGNISMANQAYVNKLLNMVQNKTVNYELPLELKNKFREYKPKNYFQALNTVEQYALQNHVNIPYQINTRRFYETNSFYNQNQYSSSVVNSQNQVSFVNNQFNPSQSVYSNVNPVQSVVQLAPLQQSNFSYNNNTSLMSINQPVNNIMTTPIPVQSVIPNNSSMFVQSHLTTPFSAAIPQQTVFEPPAKLSTTHQVFRSNPSIPIAPSVSSNISQIGAKLSPSTPIKVGGLIQKSPINSPVNNINRILSPNNRSQYQPSSTPFNVPKGSIINAITNIQNPIPVNKVSPNIVNNRPSSPTKIINSERAIQQQINTQQIRRNVQANQNRNIQIKNNQPQTSSPNKMTTTFNPTANQQQLININKNSPIKQLKPLPPQVYSPNQFSNVIGNNSSSVSINYSANYNSNYKIGRQQIQFPPPIVISNNVSPKNPVKTEITANFQQQQPISQKPNQNSSQEVQQNIRVINQTSNQLYNQEQSQKQIYTSEVQINQTEQNNNQPQIVEDKGRLTEQQSQFRQFYSQQQRQQGQQNESENNRSDQSQGDQVERHLEILQQQKYFQQQKQEDRKQVQNSNKNLNNEQGRQNEQEEYIDQKLNEQEQQQYQRYEESQKRNQDIPYQQLGQVLFPGQQQIKKIQTLQFTQKIQNVKIESKRSQEQRYNQSPNSHVNVSEPNQHDQKQSQNANFAGYKNLGKIVHRTHQSNQSQQQSTSQIQQRQSNQINLQTSQTQVKKQTAAIQNGNSQYSFNNGYTYQYQQNRSADTQNQAQRIPDDARYNDIQAYIRNKYKSYIGQQNQVNTNAVNNTYKYEPNYGVGLGSLQYTNTRYQNYTAYGNSNQYGTNSTVSPYRYSSMVTQQESKPNVTEMASYVQSKYDQYNSGSNYESSQNIQFSFRPAINVARDQHQDQNKHRVVQSYEYMRIQKMNDESKSPQKRAQQYSYNQNQMSSNKKQQNGDDILDVKNMQRSLDKKYNSTKSQQQIKQVEKVKLQNEQNQISVKKLQQNLVRFQESRVGSGQINYNNYNPTTNTNNYNTEPRFQTSQVSKIHSIDQRLSGNRRSSMNKQPSYSAKYNLNSINPLSKYDKYETDYIYSQKSSYENQSPIYQLQRGAKGSKISKQLSSIDQKFSKYVSGGSQAKLPSSKHILKPRQQNFDTYKDYDHDNSSRMATGHFGFADDKKAGGYSNRNSGVSKSKLGTITKNAYSNLNVNDKNGNYSYKYEQKTKTYSNTTKGDNYGKIGQAIIQSGNTKFVTSDVKSGLTYEDLRKFMWS